MVKYRLMKPLVSIICISYNQEKYIKQALEGLLMQKVSFSYEIIIHDDASTDGTQKIIQEFVDKNPDIIRPVFEKENRYSKSGVLFLKEMYEIVQGKYVAVCEGDDFWIEPTKLQKQVDFLENNSDYALVFHPVKVMFEGGEEPDSTFPDSINKSDFKLQNLLKTNFIHTNSVLYRRQDYTKINPNVMPFDWYMNLVHAQFGKIGFINETMSVYRRHKGGIWWEATRDHGDAFWKKYGIGHLVLYAECLRMYGNKIRYQQIIDDHIERTFNILNRINGSDKINLVDGFVESFPELSSLLLPSLSRIIFRNYQQIEVDRDNHRKVVQDNIETIEGLRQEREDILNSKTYKMGDKIARVSRIVRRKSEK